MPCDLPLMCDDAAECLNACKSFANERGVEISYSMTARMAYACYQRYLCADGHVSWSRRDLSGEAVLLVMGELGGVVIEPVPWPVATTDRRSVDQDVLPGC